MDKEIIEQGFTPLDYEVGYNKKVKFKDKDGYMYSQKWSEFIRKGKKIPVYIHNEFSIENIKNYLVLNNIKVELISKEFNKVTEPLEFIGSCGHKFESTWHGLKNRTYSTCNECSEKVYKAKKRNTKEDVFKLFEDSGLTIIEDYTYKRNNVKIACIDKQGYKGEISYANLQFGKMFQPFLKSNPYVVENIKTFLEINNIRIELISENYENCDTPLIWKCRCGELFEKQFDYIRGDKGTMCARCISLSYNSKIAIKTEDFLIENNFYFIREYKFEDCRYIRPMPFDFYIPSLNACIEVDGHQHFQPMSFHKTTNENKIKSFEKIKVKDGIKNEYCRKNNIKLLRIPYWEFEDDTYKIKINQWLGVAN